jgi:hypothetical protein
MRKKVCHRFVAALFLFSEIVTTIHAAPASVPSMGSTSRSALLAACNALLAAGVRKPYGLGWTAEGNADPQGPRIDLRPGTTPAAGLMLFRAGKMLGDANLVEAAVAVAHGMALCQRDTGKMADTAVFARFPAPQDLVAGGRDRESTTAALGFFLEILGSSSEQDPRIKTAAIRCMTWLTDQQLRDGSWSADMSLDDPVHPTHVFRLDSADWRNSTLSLLLLGDVLDRPTAAHQGTAACDALIKLQVNDPRARWASGGWSSIYHINGLPLKDPDQSPYAIDTVATMRAAQTLLGRYLLSQDPDCAQALARTAETMKPLRDNSGDWFRLYGLPINPPPRARSVVASTRTTMPSTNPTLGATRPTTRMAGTTRPGDPPGFAPWGMAQLLAAVDQLEAGTLKVPRRLVQQQIAAVLCGLTDTPFATGWESQRNQGGYWGANQGSWLSLQSRAIYSLLQQMQPASGD